MTSLILRNGIPSKKLKLYSPFEEFESMVNRMFDSYYENENKSNLNVPLELSENESSFILKAQLPGMKKENINIELTTDRVAISGEYRSEEKEEDSVIYRSEFLTGSFARSIGLPAKINHQKAKAAYENGILTLTLPKNEDEKQKITKISL